MRTRTIPLGAMTYALAVGSAVLAAFVIVPPAVAAPHMALLRELIVVALAGLVALVLRANAIIILTFIAFGAAQYVADLTFSVGPATFYGTDLILGLIVLRAVFPHDRVPLPGRFKASTRLIIFAWFAVSAVAIVKGYDSGTGLATLVRSSSPAIYWPALFFGYGAILRERSLNQALLLRQFIVVCLGFVGFMVLMRLLHHPFERSGHHLLGFVPTTAGTFRRDYGLYSAYIIYPILALIAIGLALHGRTKIARWVTVGLVGIAATAATLIRGYTYGLLIGLAVVVLLSKSGERATRGRALNIRPAVVSGVLVVLVVGSIGLSLVSPRYGTALAERSIPFLRQSAAAKENQKFRTDALQTGIRVAREHPLGLGVVDNANLLDRHQIDPDLLGHSGPATLLIFSGFLGLMAFGGAVLALCFESRHFPAAAAWFHPVFIGIAVFLVVSSFGADGIVGQSWVMAIGAFVLAVRFRLPSVGDGQVATNPRLLRTRERSLSDRPFAL